MAIELADNKPTFFQNINGLWRTRGNLYAARKTQYIQAISQRNRLHPDLSKLTASGIMSANKIDLRLSSCGGVQFDIVQQWLQYTLAFFCNGRGQLIDKGFKLAQLAWFYGVKIKENYYKKASSQKELVTIWIGL